MKNDILNKAIEIAKLSSFKKFSLCAIITNKKGNILSIGRNDYNKSHPTQAKYAKRVGNRDQIFLHAEIDSLVRLPYGAKPYAIYIARANKKGKSLLAKPCPICKIAIQSFGIKKVVYTK